VATLWASRSFTVGDELAHLGMLVADVRFRDGVILHVNGREVARRNLARDLQPMLPAGRAHGPEWETFYIPVVPGLLARGDNTLAIEVRPGSRELAPELDLRLAGRAGGGRVIRGPLVQRVTGDSAIISFQTDLPVTAAVEYGPTAERGHQVRSCGGGLAVHHEIALTGLEPGKAVHYRVIAGTEVGPSLAFATAPRAGDPVRFVVYGDVRGGHTVHGKIAQAVLTEAPDFVLTTGDLVLRGSDLGDWQRFFAVAGELLARVPVYPAAGNHDIGLAGDEERRMGELFTLWPLPPGRPSWAHWYSFDVADIHLVMLDSNAYDQPAQLDWLKADLAAARKKGARWIFAAVHDGAYSRGSHGGNKLAAQEYAPVLARHGVAVLFSGHDHIYNRGEHKGLRWVVTGGGGAPLYPITCGAPGRPSCKTEDGSIKASSEYNYVALTVHRDHALMCPRRPDRSPIEPCIRIPRPRR
jgi:hypothetical protein